MRTRRPFPRLALPEVYPDIDPEVAEQKRARLFGEEGGALVVARDEEGWFAALEGTPHVEAEGETVVAALRALADAIERASR